MEQQQQQMLCTRPGGECACTTQRYSSGLVEAIDLKTISKTGESILQVRQQKRSRVLLQDLPGQACRLEIPQRSSCCSGVLVRPPQGERFKPNATLSMSTQSDPKACGDASRHFTDEVGQQIAGSQQVYRRAAETNNEGQARGPGRRNTQTQYRYSDIWVKRFGTRVSAMLSWLSRCWTCTVTHAHGAIARIMGLVSGK